MPDDTSAKKPELKGSPLVQSYSRFSTDLDCLRELYAEVIPILREADKERSTKADALFERYSKADPTDPEKRIAEFPTEEQKVFIDTIRKIARASTLFRRNSLVSIIARYEEYLSEQIRAALELHPEKFSASEKSVPYREICALGDETTPLKFIITREVDEVMRSSSEEQLRYLDKEFKLGLFDSHKDLPICIEACERRNLCAHTGGVISKQYLDKCNNVKYPWKSGKAPEIGKRLDVPEDYYNRAIDAFFILGLRITQGLLRRMFPDEKLPADGHIVDVGFACLEREAYDLAEKVFDFALSIPDKHTSGDAMRKTFLINKCIALYHQKKSAEMNKLLDNLDWSAMHNKYVLAVSVLQEKWTAASDLMAKSELGEVEFRTWPLFREFRKREEFKTKYEVLFGKPLVFEANEKDEKPA